MIKQNSKSYIFLVCICSLRYPAYNAHAPCSNLWPDRLYVIFQHYLINGTIFGTPPPQKKVIEHKIILLISMYFVTVQSQHKRGIEV